MKAAAIIVAAGAGKRFGSAVPKQFVLLGEIPLYLWSVRAFHALPSFIQIIVVVPERWIPTLDRYRKKYDLDVVPGGKERFDSVRAGLHALKPEIRYVAIHDGARPLVSRKTIQSALMAARRYGAAVTAVRAQDSVKISATGKWVDESPARDTIWLAQTPQIFRRALIEKTYKRLDSHDITDDAQVAQRNGIPVRIVPGETRNIKITASSDLALAEFLLKQ